MPRLRSSGSRQLGTSVEFRSERMDSSVNQISVSYGSKIAHKAGKSDPVTRLADSGSAWERIARLSCHSPRQRNPACPNLGSLAPRREVT
jgi:hypothetical protein